MVAGQIVGPRQFAMVRGALTTSLAACWGFISACSLFRCLLVTHDGHPCAACCVLLISVWATIERKRWGRLALLGLSLATLGQFVTLFGAITVLDHHWGYVSSTGHSTLIKTIMRVYANYPQAALSILPLSALTGLWFGRPVVVAEFERGKQAAYAVLQRVIAVCVVSSYGVTAIFLPVAVDYGRCHGHGRSQHGQAFTGRLRLGAPHNCSSTSRIMRSAAPSSKL